MGLYKFQEQAIGALASGKHIVIAQTGCLAKGTSIRMWDGGVKTVEQIKGGDVLLSYDEYTGEIVPNEVSSVVMSCHKDKPMITLEYDGEKITTTYDHPFYNGEGFYPLYQLAWGALEASDRARLKLFCKQLGASFDDHLVQPKHSCCNETCPRCKRVFKNCDGGKDSESPSRSSRGLAEEPTSIGMCEPYKRSEGRQQNREFRVVFSEIQCLVGGEDGEHKETSRREQQENADGKREDVYKRVLQKEYRATKDECGKGGSLQRTSKNVPEDKVARIAELGKWKFKVEVPRAYYSICMRKAPYSYCVGRKHNFITHNSGKGAMAVIWARDTCKKTNKHKVLIVTTASKANMKPNDFEMDADKWCSPSFRKSLSSFSVLSWHKLAQWVNSHWDELTEYVIVFDEIAKCSAGVSSGMGRAFLKITGRNKDWAGFTATPGDVWLKFYPYFQACGLVRNKTQFLRKYCLVQTFKGFPEIARYLHEDELKRFWTSISTAPDTSQMNKELPSETHKTLTFKPPSTYAKTLKTRIAPDGTMLDTPGALCAELRRQCFTKDKQQWVKDFAENLGSGVVMFYNFIKTGDELEQIVGKSLPKNARIWRIDGKHHDIPTASTIGPNDVVLCQWQSGSEALNLQFLHYWVAVELCYSYSTAVQARGRIKRIGQKCPMMYYYLLTDNTIEQAILKCLQAKSEFSEKVWEAELKERRKSIDKQ